MLVSQDCRVRFVDHKLGLRKLHLTQADTGILAIDDKINLSTLIVEPQASGAGGIYDRDTERFRFDARDYASSIGRRTAKGLIGFAGGAGGLLAKAPSSR